jgi:hypothetical protein
MTISLLLSNPGKGGSCVAINAGGTNEDASGKLQCDIKQPDSFFSSSHVKLNFRKKSVRKLRKGAGTLIVCPMTLLGQWKVSVHKEMVCTGVL